MTTKCYVPLAAPGGKTKHVVEAMRELQGVASVDSVTGPYDVIAVVEAEDSTEMGEQHRHSQDCAYSRRWIDRRCGEHH